MAVVYVTVDLNGAGDELDRLRRGPGPVTVGRWEGALLACFAVTESRVHEITGYLKSTGHPESDFTVGAWRGEVQYARHPGIFELARGQAPTPKTTPHHHPEGLHYFFDPGGPAFEHEVRQAFWDWITDDRGGRAPTGGLGPYSGGY